MGPPAFIKNSPLADTTLGWVNVNKETLQVCEKEKKRKEKEEMEEKYIYKIKK